MGASYSALRRKYAAAEAMLLLLRRDVRALSIEVRKLEDINVRPSETALTIAYRTMGLPARKSVQR